MRKQVLKKRTLPTIHILKLGVFTTPTWYLISQLIFVLQNGFLDVMDLLQYCRLYLNGLLLILVIFSPNLNNAPATIISERVYPALPREKRYLCGLFKYFCIKYNETSSFPDPRQGISSPSGSCWVQFFNWLLNLDQTYGKSGHANSRRICLDPLF